MSGKALALIGAALAAVVVVVVVASGGQEQTVTETASNAPAAQPASSGNPNASAANTIRYANNALSPKNLTVKVGSPVTFVNDSGDDIELESDPHPQHTSFPAFGSSQDPGKPYTFTFDKPMTLKYHDHLNPSVTGTITVEN